MLAHFQLSPFLLARLHAAVQSHWPATGPVATPKSVHITLAPDSFLQWQLLKATEPGQPYATLDVKILTPTITLADTGSFQADWDNITLEYTQGIRKVMFTSSGTFTSVKMPISIADLQLPHEFAKRLEELKSQLTTALKAA